MALHELTLERRTLNGHLSRELQPVLESMLLLLERERGLDRRDALALASVAVDLRVTEIVNEVRGVHALLPDNALR